MKPFQLFCAFTLICTVGVNLYADKFPGVLGEDDRRKVDFENFATDGSQYVGALSVAGEVVCSAVLVGPNHIATAAHCVEGVSSPKGVAFHAHFQDGKGSAVASVESWEIWSGYTLGRKDSDWAVLRIAKPLGSVYGWVEPSSELVPPGTKLRSFGYPGDRLDANGIQQGVYVPQCQALAQGDTDESAGQMDCDIYYGSSGGPVLAEATDRVSGQKKKYYLAGLNVRLGSEQHNEFTQGATFRRQWLASVARSAIRDCFQRVTEIFAKDPQFAEVVAFADQIVKETDGVAAEDFGAQHETLIDSTFRFFILLDQWILTGSLPYRMGVQSGDSYSPFILEKVHPGSTAERAGLKEGDQIVAVLEGELRGLPVSHMTLTAAFALTDGKAISCRVFNRKTGESRIVAISARKLSESEAAAEAAAIQTKLMGVWKAMKEQL